jgi:ribosomal protein S27AE
LYKNQIIEKKGLDKIMKNKNLLKEDLNRFNKIMGYNPSKGLIKEDGEQLSLNFPTELTPEEQEVSDALDAMVSFVEKNTKSGHSSKGKIEKRGEQLFSAYDLDGIYKNVNSIKAQLKGDVEKNVWSMSQKKLDKLGRQRVIPFNTGEVNNVEEFLNLLDFIINSLGILGISYHYIESLKGSVEARISNERREMERRKLSGLEYEDCPRCGEHTFTRTEDDSWCDECGYAI